MHIKPKVWSNAFFLVPLVYAICNSLFIYSIIFLLAIIFSTLYHLSNEKRFSILDKIFVYLVIGYNLYLCYLSNFNEPFFLIALMYVGIGFYFLYYKNKDDYEWHASCALISLFCLLAYAL
jgi:hypothetical protein